jgi:hypothetical protein
MNASEVPDHEHSGHQDSIGPIQDGSEKKILT